MKVCKVVTTCIDNGRMVREDTTIAGNPKGYYNHSQNFPTDDSIIELVKLTIEQDKIVDPGVSCDTIIVNNDTGNEKAVKFLKSVDGIKLHSGVVKVINRDNFGRSFGGYNHAFETFKDVYDYWIFTEDDIIINGDKYFKKTIDKFNESENNGFIALQNISNQGLDGSLGDEWLHAHGGVGLSSNKVLKELYEKEGMLPHCKKEDSQVYENIIINGEIMFTNKIHQLGYKLGHIEEKLYVYAYDYMRGIIIP